MSERFQCSILPSPKISELIWRGWYVNPLLIHLHRAKDHPSRTILETSYHRAIPRRASTSGNVACFAPFGCTLTMDQVNGSEFTVVGAQWASLKLATELLCIKEEGSPFSWQISCWHEAAVVQARCALLQAGGSSWLSVCVLARLTWVHLGGWQKGKGFAEHLMKLVRSLMLANVHIHRVLPPKMLKWQSRGLWRNKSLVLHSIWAPKSYLC